ncbi:BZ3500_MvSof-1268-A1-R1_Chr1-1g01227 [Microbotryum saponariae]|uniref:BZ3500_MvSof-1268-A1-R1_Chr1-1g01227 protein n=1 Tax=Microbotryum saponariae TaxID=289078 RepID=A0A2X0K8T3_9BASI|nr:BZ3500_MvSof-1268-A1-R1_Chr1-1g01227 [Microbotryum saponariae]SCZ93724.1 BZ3501_MvSof-1269-A2-R1_Chr1-1g00823 [Microbotryum saponariae]
MTRFAPTQVLRCPRPRPHDHKDILARTITSFDVTGGKPLFCFEPIYDNPGLYSCRVGWPSDQAPNQKHDVIAWLKLDQQSP